MSQQYVDLQIAVRLLPCGECGAAIALSEAQEQHLRRTHETFYCPNGHRRHWPGKSDLEELRDRLVRAEDRANVIQTRMTGELRTEEARSRRLQGKLGATTAARNRILRRVAAGVCPHCRRHFEDLARHMTSKHPECCPAPAVPSTESPGR